MSAASDYLENKVLDHVLKVASFTQPAALYLALYTAAPSDSGGGTEVSGGSYARQAVTFAAASGGTSASSATVTFPVATANWGTIGWIGIFDASTSGNLLFHGAVTAAKTIETGDTFQVTAGNLTISLA